MKNRQKIFGALESMREAVEDWLVPVHYKEACEMAENLIQEEVFRRVTHEWHHQGLDSSLFRARSLDRLEDIYSLDSVWRSRWENLTICSARERFKRNGESAFFVLFEDASEKQVSYATSCALKLIRRIVRRVNGSDLHIPAAELRHCFDVFLGEGASEKIRKFAVDGLSDILSRIEKSDKSITIEDLFRYYDILSVLGVLGEEDEKILCCRLMRALNTTFRQPNGGYVDSLKESEPFTCSTHFALRMAEGSLDALKNEGNYATVVKQLEESVVFLLDQYMKDGQVGEGFAANKDSKKPFANKLTLVHTWLTFKTLIATERYLNAGNAPEKHVLNRLGDGWLDGLKRLLQNCYSETDGISGFAHVPPSTPCMPSLYATECAMGLIKLLRNNPVAKIADAASELPWLGVDSLHETLMNKPNPYTGNLTGWIRPRRRQPQLGV